MSIHVIQNVNLIIMHVIFHDDCMAVSVSHARVCWFIFLLIDCPASPHFDMMMCTGGVSVIFQFLPFQIWPLIHFSSFCVIFFSPFWCWSDNHSHCNICIMRTVSVGCLFFFWQGWSVPKPKTNKNVQSLRN